MPLFALLLVTLVVRGGALVLMWDNLSEDRDAYRHIAENLATYRIYGMTDPGSDTPRPTAYRPPLYPVLLAKLAGESLQVTPLRVAALHLLLGLATVWLTWLVGNLLPLPLGEGRGEGVLDRAAAQISERQQTLTLTLSQRERGPILAGLLVACDPILLHWSTYVMTETLAAFLAILSLYCLTRFHFDRRPMNAAFAGCALGLAVLCRPTFLPWLGLCGVAMLLLKANVRRSLASGGRQPPDDNATPTTPDSSPGSTSPRGDHRCAAVPGLPLAKNGVASDFLWRFANLAALGLVAAAVIFPWGYRNYRQFGKPIITTTHGGYTFYLANNRFCYDYLRMGNYELPWDPPPTSKRLPDDEAIAPSFNDSMALLRWESGRDLFKGGMNRRHKEYELVIDERSYAASLGAVRDHPQMFAYSCLYRIAQLWSPLPHKLTADESWRRTVLRYLTAAWYLAVFLAALVGIWRLRWRLFRSPWIFGLVLCLVFTGVHTFYWSNMRMRVPLMPFVALVAAASIGRRVHE